MAISDLVDEIIPSGNLDPRASLALRQRIALQMMANAGKGKGYPKNIGEGLTAIGDALGERGLARQLAAMDVASQGEDKTLRGGLPAEAPASNAGDTPDTSTVTPRTTSEAVPADSVPAAKPAVVTEPNDTPIVRTNPDGTISGNITAPQAQPATTSDATPDATPPPVVPAATTTPFDPRLRAQTVARIASLLTPAAAAPSPPPAAPVVPQSNPILAGQVPASLRSSPALPPGAVPPGGRLSDQRVASLDPTVLPPVIRQAPPQQQIRTMPPVQVAQALTPDQQAQRPVPPPNFSYVMPGVSRPVQPLQTPQSAREQAAQQAIMDHPGNPYVAQSMNQIIAEEKAKRDFIDAKNNARYQKELEIYGTDAGTRQQQIQNQAERNIKGLQDIETYKNQKAQNDLRAQFGNLPAEDVLKMLGTTQGAAKTAQQAIVGLQNAKDAFDRGIVGGYGADGRLTFHKMLGLLGKKSSGNLAADTEVFKAAMQPIVASILHQTSGTSQLSEGELAFARAAAAGNISLEPGAIHHLLTILDKANRAIITDHSNRVNAMFPPNQVGPHTVYDVPMPPPLSTAPKAAATRTIVSSPDEARRLPPGTKFEFIAPDGKIMQGTVPLR